jgi:DNA integrity scanning protein DisA with diadenylate cyclase activity
MEEQINHQEPNVDYSLQFSLAKNNEKIERCIFESLQDIAKSVHESKSQKTGSLIVLGDFEKFGPKIKGMVQMKPKQNPVESLIMMERENGESIIRDFSGYGFDGAMIVDKTGQVIGAGVYLVIDQPMLDTPEDCGTRHKAAASFSKRSDVISVLTLSEETNTVRIWQDGKVKEVFRISEDEEEKKQKKKGLKQQVVKEIEE